MNKEHINYLLKKLDLGDLQSLKKPGSGLMTENVLAQTDLGLFFIKERSEWHNNNDSIKAHFSANI